MKEFTTYKDDINKKKCISCQKKWYRRAKKVPSIWRNSPHTKTTLTKSDIYLARKSPLHCWSQLDRPPETNLSILKIICFTTVHNSKQRGHTISVFHLWSATARGAKTGRYQTLPLGSKSSICHEKNRFYNCIFLSEIWKVKCWTVNDGEVPS